jgi:hypothetical protein
MMSRRNLIIRVKTGSSWVRIENVAIIFWVEYRSLGLSWNKDTVSSVDIRDLVLPSWSECYRKTIKEYLENNPEVLANSYNDKVIEVI